MKNFFGVSVALLSGVILPFAFAPYGYFPLAIIALLGLMIVWQNTTPTQAFCRGLIFGVGAFGVGVYWVFISIYRYGGAGMVLSSIITAGFILLLALFPALQGYVLQRYFPYDRASKWLLAFPALWVLFEWVRSWIFTGFPWLLLGDSQTNSLLRGFIPVTGMYGTSFLVALSAGLLWFIFRGKHRCLSALGLVLLWISGEALAQISWTTPMSPLLPVTLVQGNITQGTKWTPDQATNTLNLYQQFTENHWQSRIIVWPETAVPLLLPDAIPFLQKMNQKAMRKKTAIITGIPIPQDDNYYNGVIVLGNGAGHYFKRHLVPFGEYVPLEKWLGKLLQVLDLPMSGFSAGPVKQPLLHAANIKVAPFVCYEIAYTNLLRVDLPTANLLVTLSDDAWFDRSSALGQHLQIAQFAALVSGRYMLVATDSGKTAIINPQGKLLAQAPIDQAATLSGEIQGMTGATPWVKIGDLPFIIIFLLLLVIVWRRQQAARLP